MSTGADKQPTVSKLPALADSAMDAGKVVLSAAAAGARTGAKLAVGTFFAGCNLLLDVGAQAVRRMPLGEGAAGHDPIPLAATPVPPLGWWSHDGRQPEAGNEALRHAIHSVGQPIIIVGHRDRIAVAPGGMTRLGTHDANAPNQLPVLAIVPPLHPTCLGDASFRTDYSLKYAYLTGAMANGIGSEEIVEAMSRNGCLGFFGAAGLSIDRVAQAIDRIQCKLVDRPYGFNLIHSPNEPAIESAVVDLYLRRSVHLVDASAYLDVTLPLIRYRVKGIRREADGRIVCPNRVIAKVSRAEVARKFLSPPPESILAALVKSGDISEEQATWAATIPIAADMTVEADSGGHTDNRPALTLLPGMIALRNEMQSRYVDAVRLRVGAAGGIATPASAAAAFAMGAAYIMTGSINQACREAGTSQAVREMLAHAGPADVMMAPAADMFEMGVKVQVLKWGTLFGVRARKLYDLYRTCVRLEDIPDKDRTVLERDYFRCSLEQAWQETRKFFEARDPRQITRAEGDPKYKMALVFRSYLGRSSDWANRGDPTRKADYQIWCGPAMGAFNEWARGSFLEQPTHRSVVTVAGNLLLGAAVLTRVNWLRAQGIDVPHSIADFRPVPDDEIVSLLGDSFGQSDDPAGIT